MARITIAQRSLWVRRIAALSSGAVARSHAAATIRAAVEASLPAPHRAMIRGGFGRHLHSSSYWVDGLSASAPAGADGSKLADNPDLIKTLRRQFPLRLRNQATYSLRREVVERLRDLNTVAKVLAKYPEIAPVISDEWPGVDKAKLRRALRRAGWPLP